MLLLNPIHDLISVYNYKKIKIKKVFNTINRQFILNTSIYTSQYIYIIVALVVLFSIALYIMYLRNKMQNIFLLEELKKNEYQLKRNEESIEALEKKVGRMTEENQKMEIKFREKKEKLLAQIRENKNLLILIDELKNKNAKIDDDVTIEYFVKKKQD
ncbi:hypothetical protein SAMN05444412_12013 [Rhodonellum ikkaensis]|nr:hypothetical protein SAMN05444412_12013 [Rhodonellum ikkaensis]